MEAHMVLLLASTTLLISSAILNQACAETYMVGDGDKWSTGVNYLTWSEKHSFVVGDVLFFSYVKGQHDACEVTEETYRTCDSSTGVISSYASGQDRVALAEARDYWFVCSTAGHCNGGMKFRLTVRPGNSTSPGNSAATEPATRPSAAPPGGGWWMAGLLCLVAAVGSLQLHLPF
ncbi:hypothetical protein Taro_006855 [Colocasia esculenta]|uniref:Phytocyanin domain-containing protein n=1 Tax=Colocasia esculenta TaxID=4460 RepID=A0A843TPV4_COLES|nr:hypothetical protein [Colocasia esculenta]